MRLHHEMNIKYLPINTWHLRQMSINVPNENNVAHVSCPLPTPKVLTIAPN